MEYVQQFLCRLALVTIVGCENVWLGAGVGTAEDARNYEVASVSSMNIFEGCSSNLRTLDVETEAYSGKRLTDTTQLTEVSQHFCVYWRTEKECRARQNRGKSNNHVDSESQRVL